MSNVTPLRRTAIIVRDLERSLRFYQGALGLTVWKQGGAGPDNEAFSRLLGAPPCTLRYAIMQSDDVEWGMVGLFELSDPAPPEDRHHTPSRANRGEACLVFHAPDLRRVHRLARRLGATVLCPPTRLVLPQHGLESLEMTLRDPDGVLLNFIQNVRGGLAPHNSFPGIAQAAGKAKPVRRPAKSARRKPAGTSRAAGGRRAAAKRTGKPKAARPRRK